jgi:hypothetical protein
LLEGIGTTEFNDRNIREVLSLPPHLENWRVGEGIAEAYLVANCTCEFPWPFGRDARNPNASPAGADLVGFHYDGGSIRFAFGEAKTSGEKRWPPQTMTSRTGLGEQLESLGSSFEKKNLLVRYLAHRAINAAWENKFKDAAKRYLSDPADISLFGFLIRDVTPKHNDLYGRARVLAGNCPPKTSIKLYALYLPEGCIEQLINLAMSARGIIQPWS